MKFYFFFLFIDTATTDLYTACHTLSRHDALPSYAAAGERLGLSPDEALRLAAATFGGATAVLADSGEKPGALAAKVASKGGMTQVGLDILDTDGQLVAQIGRAHV